MEYGVRHSVLAGRRKLRYDRHMAEANGSNNPPDVSLLLIEDDDIDAMAVKRSFNGLAIKNRVIRARDGTEALEMLRQGQIPQPAIILLDINMPRMNGIEFLKALRQDPVFGDSVVFVLTTSALQSDIAAAYNAHVAGYIVKKSQPDSFAEVAKMLVAYWHLVELPMHAKN
jgi:CheY-like chemotaxis protein